MTTRRSFIGGILAGFTAPAVISSGVARGILMPPKVVVPVDPFGTRGFLRYDGRVWSDSFVAFVDTLRPDGGINRKWIPASEWYKPPVMNAEWMARLELP